MMAHPVYKTGAEVPAGPPDPRNYQWSDSGLGGAPPTAATLPQWSVMPTMLQQHQDCGPCATRAMIYCATRKDIAARYHYFYSRKASGNFPQDAGTYAPTNMSIASKGLPLEPDWPYPGDINETPSAPADAAAQANKITYFQCSTLADIQSAISSGHAVGLHIYATNDWYWPIACPGGSYEVGPATAASVKVGGHFVVAVGYDMLRKCSDGSMGAVKILNSWGTGWGQQGLAWLPLYWLTPAGGHAGSRYAITSQMPAEIVPVPSPLPIPVPVEPEKPMPTARIAAARVTAKQYDGIDFSWTTENAVDVLITLNGKPYTRVPQITLNGSGWTSMPAGDLTIVLTATSSDGQTATSSYTVKNTATVPTPTPTPAPANPDVLMDIRLFKDNTWKQL